MIEKRKALTDICQTLSLPLLTVIRMLREQGVTDEEMAPKLPPYSDPLCVEYRKVIKRLASSKRKQIVIRRVKKSAASQTATA